MSVPPASEAAVIREALDQVARGTDACLWCGAEARQNDEPHAEDCPATLFAALEARLAEAEAHAALDSLEARVEVELELRKAAYERIAALEDRLAEAERALEKARERERTNNGTVTRVLAQEVVYRKTLGDIGRWLGHPATATDSDVQLVIGEIEHVLAHPPESAEEAR